MNDFDEFYAAAKKKTADKADLLAHILESKGRTEELMDAAQDPKLLEALYKEFDL